MGALGVTVTSSVLGTGLVVGLLGHTTVLGHLDEVQGTVETALKLGNIDIEGELLVLEVEHLVLSVGSVHEVDTGADVGRVGALLDKLVGEGSASAGNTVSSGVVGT